MFSNFKVLILNVKNKCMPQALYDCRTAVINSDLFVFDGYLKKGVANGRVL